MITIRDAMTDPALFGSQFAGASWDAWRALLAGLYGLALTEGEAAVFERLTRREPPSEAAEELWLVMGRRGGKSNVAALLAVFESAFRDYSDRLAPGEVATVLVLAADRKQARTCMRYVAGLLKSNPMTERMIVREDRESIELSNGCVIEVGTSSFRSVRGYTVACVIADEIAFWRSEDSANPDAEVLNALRPALATLGGKLIALSSPYARRGALWDTYQRHYGKPGPILVAQAETRVMNPGLPQRVVEQAYERDASAAAAEYGAQFRNDLEQFLNREVVDAALRTEPLELPFARRHRYRAFVDPSGGGQDEFTLAIGHREGDRTVVDLVRGLRGTPAEIVAEYVAVLRAYGIRQVRGDRYAGSWPGDEFGRHHVQYEASEKARSDLYLDLLPALNSGRVELPPDERLAAQLVGLERRTARSGRESIDHPPGAHDDRANAVAGLVSALGGAGVGYPTTAEQLRVAIG